MTDTVTRMDVDYVTMLTHRVVRYRWNTPDSDQWRRMMLQHQQHNKWDHTEYLLDKVPEYAAEEARRRLGILCKRAQNTVLHNEVIANLTLAEKQFIADVMIRDNI